MYGDAITTDACFPIERAWYRINVTVRIKGGWNAIVAVGVCPRCNNAFLQFVCCTLVMIDSLCS